MRKERTAKISGWQEWLALPDIGIPGIEARIDTSSPYSWLHTSFVEHYRREGDLWVRFGLHPSPKHEDIRIVCQLPVKSQQTLTVAGNREESLFVVEADVEIGDIRTPVELVLISQKNGSYAMRLGRDALQKIDVLIDPQSSYLFGDCRMSIYDGQLQSS